MTMLVRPCRQCNSNAFRLVAAFPWPPGTTWRRRLFPFARKNFYGLGCEDALTE